MKINFSDKCEVKIDDKLGRYVAAAKDIKAGELLLSEEPAVVGPYWDSKICCLNCYSQSTKMCKQCKLAPLCLVCQEHDQYECEFLKNSNLNSNFLLDHFDLLTPLRFIMLARNKLRRECYESVLEMESHCNQRIDTPIWKLHNKNVIQPLRKIVGLLNENENDEFLQKICGILDVNTFEVRTFSNEDIILRGLYPNAALLAHDCCGNTFITLDAEKILRIYASVPISLGQPIYNNYTSTLFGTIPRQEHLKEGKYFSCNCLRCNDPTEFGTNLSSLMCQSCLLNSKNGYIVHVNNNSSTESVWKCENCETTLSNSAVKELLGMARLEIFSTQMDVMRLEEFIEKYSKILNPNHYLVIEMKQKLTAILRNLCENSCARLPPIKILTRKIQLCKELIPVLKILQPGISRLTAIATYEYFTSNLTLIQIQFTNKEITPKQYLDELTECELLAKESIGILIYEPTSTPEGDLAKQAIWHLKKIRELIDRQYKSQKLKKNRNYKK